MLISRAWALGAKLILRNFAALQHIYAPEIAILP
jgi:hypothetical protein